MEITSLPTSSFCGMFLDITKKVYLEYFSLKSKNSYRPDRAAGIPFPCAVAIF
jgi:hypothetical protein